VSLEQYQVGTVHYAKMDVKAGICCC